MLLTLKTRWRVNNMKEEEGEEEVGAAMVEESEAEEAHIAEQERKLFWML